MAVFVQSGGQSSLIPAVRAEGECCISRVIAVLHIRGQIVGARDQDSLSLWCIEGQVSRVMSAYHHEEPTTSNRRKLSERDVWVLNWIVSKKHKTTASHLTAELNVLLNSPVSTRTVRQKPHRVNIHACTVTRSDY